MSRSSPTVYREYRARAFFEQTIGLLRVELALNPNLDLTEAHCPRRTINQHVRSLEYALEQMPDSAARSDCESQLAEVKREIAKRDTNERRRMMRAVMS